MKIDLGVFAAILVATSIALTKVAIADEVSHTIVLKANAIGQQIGPQDTTTTFAARCCLKNIGSTRMYYRCSKSFFPIHFPFDPSESGEDAKRFIPIAKTENPTKVGVCAIAPGDSVCIWGLFPEAPPDSIRAQFEVSSRWDGGWEIVGTTIPSTFTGRDEGFTHFDCGSGSPRFPCFDWVPLEEPPIALEKVPPEYPDAARENELEGTVLIKVLIGEDGRVVKTIVVESVPGLEKAAVKAVQQWTFEPAVADGKPVPMWVMIPVRFTMR